MKGIDPYSYMQQLARRLPELTGRGELEAALDDMEYLFDLITPELQDPAEELIAMLREKLRQAS